MTASHLVLLEPAIDHNTWLRVHGLPQSVGNAIVVLHRPLLLAVLIVHSGRGLLYVVPGVVGV